MKADSLKEALAYVPDHHNLTNVVLSVAFIRLDMKVQFIPISFSQRSSGTNSINLPKIARIGIGALRDFVQINKRLP